MKSSPSVFEPLLGGVGWGGARRNRHENYKPCGGFPASSWPARTTLLRQRRGVNSVSISLETQTIMVAARKLQPSASPGV
ncbi:hypothetical protein RRG08_009476 [Elysia crispata]|uniref:Uncharacterized protein n=1 Tax=Elysia crispata TaxID=231223 RepID=A0AAE1ASJ2_9GAST|nr:hypothetical protein RRG08_009476 [Elysia crispata]